MILFLIPISIYVSTVVDIVAAFSLCYWFSCSGIHVNLIKLKFCQHVSRGVTYVECRLDKTRTIIHTKGVDPPKKYSNTLGGWCNFKATGGRFK